MLMKTMTMVRTKRRRGSEGDNGIHANLLVQWWSTECWQRRLLGIYYAATSGALWCVKESIEWDVELLVVCL